MQFFITLFGRSWSASGEVPGRAFTIAILLAVSFLVLRALVVGRKEVYVVTLLCICTFAILNAAMTAAARWQYGIAGRYETPVYLFWCAFGLLCFYYVGQNSQKVGLLAFESLFAAAVILSVRNIRGLRSEAIRMGDSYRTAQAAMASGVLDGDAVQIFNVSLAWTFGELSFLARQKASLFAVPPTSRKEQKLLATYKIRGSACPGEIAKPSWIPDDNWPGVTVFGRLPSNPRHALGWVIITDQQKKIVGFGSTSEQDSPNHWGGTNGRGTRWKAYIPGAAARGGLLAFEVLDDNSVCALNASAPIEVPHGPEIFDVSEASGLEDVWRPTAANTSVVGGTIFFSSDTLTVHSTTMDAQLNLSTKVDLRQFATLVLKAKFERKDSVELFFGPQINGRGLIGFTDLANQWVYVFAQVGRNRFWRSEAGKTFRFDPTGGLGVGATTQISGVWGSRKPIAQGADMFEFAIARKQSP